MCVWPGPADYSPSSAVCLPCMVSGLQVCVPLTEGLSHTQDSGQDDCKKNRLVLSFIIFTPLDDFISPIHYLCRCHSERNRGHKHQHVGGDLSIDCHLIHTCGRSLLCGVY